MDRACQNIRLQNKIYHKAPQNSSVFYKFRQHLMVLYRRSPTNDPLWFPTSAFGGGKTLHELQHHLHRRCNTIDAEHHIICRKATSFIADNIILCPPRRNDVDHKWSNDVLALLVMMLCPYGHKHKKDILLDVFFDGSPCWT